MKNVLKVSLFVSLLLLSLFSYHNITNKTFNQDYLVSYGRGLINKFEKLELISSKKIVIAGGSNVAFGIDSDLMETILKVPVVNMGLHGGLNTYVIIEPVLPYLKKGDVLIISREYDEKLYGSSQEVANYFSYMPFKAKKEVYKNLNAISPILKQFATNSQNYIRNYKFEKQHLKKDGTYSYDAFKNDNIHSSRINYEMADDLYNSFEFSKLHSITDKELIDYYKNLKRELDKKGVKVFFSLPSIADNKFKKIDMLRYYSELSSASGIQMLSDKTFDYSQKLMLNSEYHLNELGREDRSITLSNELEGLLPEISVTSSSHFTKHLVLKPNVFSDFLAINSCYQSIYHKNDSTLEFKNIEDGTNNYSRIKMKGNAFKNKDFKIIIEGDTKILRDIKFRAIAQPQEWDEVNINGNQYEFIKYNVSKSFHTDNNSYAGITLNNLEKHSNSKIKINSIEIIDTPYFQKYIPSLKLKTNKKYMFSISEKSSILNILLQGNSRIPYYFKKNSKYVIHIADNFLHIQNLYDSNSPTKIKLATNKISFSGSIELVEVYQIQ